MARKLVDIAVVLIDASPLLTLARVDRLDVLDRFTAPIRIVDQVRYEVTKSANDPIGRVAAWLQRRGNSVEFIETAIGLGFTALRDRNPEASGRNMGELAMQEYAMDIIQRGPSYTPLVVFEDPDVLRMPIATSKRVHLLNTAALLVTMETQGIVPDGLAVLEAINAERRTPMIPFEQAAKTKKIRSTWIRKVKPDDG